MGGYLSKGPPARRVMIGLWVIDRIGANTLPPDLMMFFFLYAYALCGVALLAFHWERISVVVASMLLITAIACGLGGFGYLSWDVTGSIQEGAGLIAMSFIFWRRGDGPNNPVTRSDLDSNPIECDPVGVAGRTDNGNK